METEKQLPRRPLHFCNYVNVCDEVKEATIIMKELPRRRRRLPISMKLLPTLNVEARE